MHKSAPFLESVQSRPLYREMILALKELAFDGVDRSDDRLIFVYGGDSVHAFHVMLAESGEFNVLMAAPKEDLLANVAFGWAQTHPDQVTVISTTYGAGTGPVIEQLKKAKDKGLPIVLIGGAHPDSDYPWVHAVQDIGTGRVRPHLEAEIAEQIGIPVFSLTADSDPRQLATSFADAILTAREEQTPVFVELQPGILNTETNSFAVDPKQWKREILTRDRGSLTNHAIKAIESLNDGTKVVLHVGENLPGRLREKVEEVRERLGIVTTVEWAMGGYLRMDDPNYAGPYLGAMSTENSATREYVEHPNTLVVKLATPKKPLMLNGAGTLAFPDKTIAVERSPLYPKGQDIEFFLDELNRLADQLGTPKQGSVPGINFAEQVMNGFEWNEATRENALNWTNLHQVLGHFNLHVVPNDVDITYTVDPGTPYFATSMMPTRGHAPTVVSNRRYSQMGVALSQAMAVALQGQRVPIALVGDGSWYMSQDMLFSFVRLYEDGFIDHAVLVLVDNQCITCGAPQVNDDIHKRLLKTRANKTDLVNAYQAIGVTETYEATTNGEFVNALDSAVRNKGIHVIVASIPEDADVPRIQQEYGKRAAPVIQHGRRSANDTATVSDSHRTLEAATTNLEPQIHHACASCQ